MAWLRALISNPEYIVFSLFLVGICCLAFWQIVVCGTNSMEREMRKHKAMSEYHSLQSQGKYCPPEKLEEARKRLEGLG